jgi:hypothetical protein
MDYSWARKQNMSMQTEKKNQSPGHALYEIFPGKRKIKGMH